MQEKQHDTRTVAMYNPSPPTLSPLPNVDTDFPIGSANFITSQNPVQQVAKENSLARRAEHQTVDIATQIFKATRPCG